MIEQIQFSNALVIPCISIIDAEPGDEFVIARRHNKFDSELHIIPLVVERVLKRDVICKTSEAKEMRFDKNKEISNAYVMDSEELAMFKAKQSKNDLTSKAWIIATRMKQYDLNADDPKDWELIKQLIDFHERKSRILFS